MNGPTLQVQMLGQFTLRYGDRTISDSDDRSRRVWSLLAYMLYNHGRSFAQEELIHLYWSNNEKSADPGNALKSIFHRIRTALDKLQPGLGRLLIRRKDSIFTKSKSSETGSIWQGEARKRVNSALTTPNSDGKAFLSRHRRFAEQNLDREQTHFIRALNSARGRAIDGRKNQQEKHDFK